MPATAKQRRSDRLVARVTPEDKTLLERAAAIEGCSVAVFVVSHGRAAAKQVLRERETIRLSEEQSRRFATALLAKPRRPTKRTQSALALYRETVIEQSNTTKSETKGTKMAAKMRQRANRLSDEERQAALGRALEVIYKGQPEKGCAHSR